MRLAANLLVALVAFEHLAFLVLEMFLWTTPTGMRVFGMTPEVAEASVSLAANQGLYNGFLAAGLLWGLVRKDNYATVLFFLGCVIVAGAFGGLTAKTSILFVQGGPALIALLLVLLARSSSPAELDPGGTQV